MMATNRIKWYEWDVIKECVYGVTCEIILKMDNN